MIVRCFAALSVWVVVGCADDSPSCAVAAADGNLLVCVDYADSAAGSDARASCADSGGTWRQSPCDEGAVASCVFFGSTTWYYAGYLAELGMTIADLRETCEEVSGEFAEL